MPRKKLRGEQIVQRIGRTRHYQTSPIGLRAMADSWFSETRPSSLCWPLRNRSAQLEAKPIDAHYRTIQIAVNGVFHELGLAA